MEIKELVTYKGQYLPQVQEERGRVFIKKALQNLEFLKAEIAGEDQARVNISDVSIAVSGFKDEDLGKQVQVVVFDILSQ